MMQRAPAMPVPCFTDPGPTASRPDIQQLKAAAARAAAQAAHGVRTQFFDRCGDGAGTFNPLALVLSYGEDEDDDEDDDGDNDRTQAHKGASGERNLLTAIAGREHGSPDPLAGFLSELQSEGLLDADDEAAAAALEAPDPQPELPSGPRQEAGTSGPESAQALRGTAAARAEGHDHAAASGRTPNAAVQPEVLRWVAGGPWARVRDAASMHEFYWHSDTKESAWSLPDGVVDTDATTGSAQQHCGVAGDAGLGTSDDQALLHARPAVQPPNGNANGPRASAPPDGWVEARDEASGDVYYWHIASGAVQWERPVGAPTDGAQGPQASHSRTEEASSTLESASEQLAALVDDDGTADEDLPHTASARVEAAHAVMQRGTESSSRQDGSDAEAEQAHALLQHDRASTALTAALTAASEGGALAALLATAPRLLLLHAQLQTRQHDLAALQRLLQGEGAAEGASTVGAACRYIEQDIAAAAAELPAAHVAAEALLGAGVPGESAQDTEHRDNGADDTIANPLVARAAGASPCPVQETARSGQASESTLEVDEPAPPLPDSDPCSPSGGISAQVNHRHCSPPLPPGSAEGPGVPTADNTQSSTFAAQSSASLSEAVAGITPAVGAVEVDVPAADDNRSNNAKRPAQPIGDVHAPKRAKRNAAGKSGALVSKWQSVAKGMEVEEAARQQPGNLLARELVKNADIEEWVAQQYRSGEAQRNPNFIPVATDWRARIAARVDAAREAADSRRTAEASAQADHAVLRFDSVPDLELLSVGLQDGWQAMWDASSGAVYYGNVAEKVRAEA